ncbi:MAG: VOC family protein, partial [Chloroflexota bacterium]
QYQAAQWYQQRFGLEIVSEYQFWAETGPLMISSDNGNTMLALFQGDGPGFNSDIGFRRVAFRVDSVGFFTFLERLSEYPVFDQNGHLTHQIDVVDHDLAYSLYFCDPYGYQYEVTTYDYELVSNQLPKSG